MLIRTGLSFLVILLAPTIATAQPPTYEPAPAPIEEPPEPMTLDSVGFSLAAGGGVEGFTGNTMRSTTTDGGNWNVRAALGTRQYLAFEGSYIGSAQAIDALGLDRNATLVGNGVQGAIRINATTSMELQPFLFAGVAWRHYEITNADFNTSDISDSDDVVEVPMGVGVAFKTVGGFLVDARGEFRAVTDEDLVPSLSARNANDKASMHRWGVNANIGIEF
jgi:hypothetical protein